MRARSSSPPLHVHVSESTPVHVHVKKSSRGRTKSASSARPVATPKVPWIPPGTGSNRQTAYKGTTRHVDTAPPPELNASTSPHLASEEELLHGRIHQYERKIDSLMTEVSTLKNQVALREKEHQLEQQWERLSSSQRVLAQQEEQLAVVALELQATEQENIRLRGSVEKGSAQPGGDVPHRKASEGGVTATPITDAHLMLQELETRESSETTLRRLLREQHLREMDSLRHQEQKDSLLSKLAEEEEHSLDTLAKLKDKEKEVDQLSSVLEMEKASVRRSESTCAHLQRQLRNKEAENSRLHVKIRNLDRSLTRQQEELLHLQEQLRALGRRAEGDQEALRKARRGGDGRRLMEEQLAAAVSVAEEWSRRHAGAVKEREELEKEICSLNSRVTELTDHARAERSHLLERLQETTAQSADARLDNQSLKATLTVLEDKLVLSQSELQQAKVSLKQYESLVDGYKAQVQASRGEADESASRLKEAERDGRMLREELEQVQKKLLGHLEELQPLRRSQQDARENQRSQERRSAELGGALAELRLTSDQQVAQLEVARQRNLTLLEDKKQLQQKVDVLERKLEEATAQNGELLQVISKREESIRSVQQRLEEKSRESRALSLQQDEALDQARRQVTQSRERAALKERTTQSKLVELETRLSRATTEHNQLRRDKQEALQRLHSRLQDLTDRLERSDTTNRSLNNYIHFLKTSYASVFEDSVFSSAALRPPSPI